jgi:glutamate dehydrogenase (NAD(P)+)
VKVVGIADKDGLVHNDDGLDVERLLLTRDLFGVVDRSKLRRGDRQLAGDQWLTVDAEVLVPAAMSYAITVADVPDIKASVIAEAANVATLADAEAALVERGVTVVPDFVANVGTNAWWWWVAFGDIEPTVDDSLRRLSTTLRPLTLEVLRRAADAGVSPRQAATEISHEKRASIAVTFPASVKAPSVVR